MTLQETAGLSEQTVAEGGDLEHVTLRRARRSGSGVDERHSALATRHRHIRASFGPRLTRDRCLVLVDPRLFEHACEALGAAEDGPEITFSVGREPAPLRSLLDGSVRQVVEAHGRRRVLIAPSGRGAEEQMLELTVDSALEKVTVSMPRLGLTRSGEFMKRGFDVIVAGVALVVAVPILAVIALLVRMGSPGPALFRQTRVGRGGRPFEMLKFRTMVDDAEARKSGLAALNEREGLFKIRDDPRVTPIGRLLRRTNLDELPQLINVLGGEMSLVGPRPLVPDEDARIRGWRRRRLDVPPGMTGCWQVGTSRISLDEMVVIDHLYTANWSLWRDVKCILGTVPLMFLRRGS